MKPLRKRLISAALALTLLPVFAPSAAEAQLSSFGSSGGRPQQNPQPDPDPTPDPDPAPDPVKPQPSPPIFDTDPIDPDELDIPTAGLEDIVVNPDARDASVEEATQLFGTLSSIDDVVGEHTVPTSTVRSSRLEEGSVLSIPPSENIPGGVLVVVEDINVNPTGNVSTIITRQGDISDVIPETNGLIELSGTPSDVRVVAAEDATMDAALIGEAAANARPSWANGDGINDSEDVARAYSTSTPGNYNLISIPFTVDLKRQLSGVEAASVSGNIESKVKTTLKTTMLGGVEQFSLSLDSRVLATADFEAQRALAAAIDKKIGDVFVTVPIPGVPVSLTMKAEVNLGASAEASGSFRYTSRINARSTTGIQYKDNRVRPVQEKSLTTREYKNLSGNMSLTATFNTKASAQVNVLSVLDAGVEASSDLRASFVATVANTDLSCVATLDARIGITYSLLRASDSHSTGWVPISTSGNLCAGEVIEPEEPVVDLTNVVPRGLLRTCVNEQLGRFDDSDHPISADEMATLQDLSIGWGYGTGEASLEGLQYATNLKSLSVYEGDISVTDIPDISLLPRLKWVYLNFADNVIFPPAEGDFPALEQIYLIGGLQEIPAEIVEAPLLIDLRIMDAPRLSALPEDAEYSATLLYILINNTGITTLPEALRTATSLEGIALEDNDSLVSLPLALGTHPSLMSISIEGADRLTALPETLGSHPALTNLTLRYLPRLQSIPNPIGSSPGLTTVTISDAPRLTTFPAAITSPTLKTLRLSAVPVLQWPSDMSAAHSLTEVNVPENNLTEVPAAIGTIPSLQRLDLRSNNISRLPEFLVTMVESKTLEYIYVRGNPVNTTDPVYQKLIELEVLGIW